MKKKGFLFIDVLIGIFLLGMIAISTLPILNTALVNFKRIKKNTEMNYIGELVVEKLKSKDDISLEVLNGLNTLEEVEINSKMGDFTDKYSCTVLKLKDSENLWELKILVSPIESKGNRYVEYMASIPKK